jgi:signal transduction histidine kinase
VDENIKIIVLLRDITEKKMLEAESMHAGHLAAMGELAAGVAHEINNPINGIINYAEILKEEYQEKGQNDEILNRIIKESERVAQIVNNLLSFARDRKEEHTLIDINEILWDALGLLENQIKKDSIKCEKNIPPGLPMIWARGHEIQQVFMNVISNARYALNTRFPEYHKDKVLTITGESKTMHDQEYVRMTFYDHGTGIPVNILNKICNPFFSTKPKGEGTGLGLSISHGIVKNHGGNLSFESVEGRYTKVMIDFPVSNQ